MPDGVDGIGLNSNTVPQESQAGSAQPVVVESNGQNVVYQPSLSSLVEDAQEETTVLFQEKASTTLGRREAKSRSSSRMEELLKKFLHKVSSVNQAEKFQQTLESLKKMGKPSPALIRQKLDEMRQGTEDEGFESGMLLALEAALKARRGNEDLLAAVQEAKSGLGTELREFYQDHVKTYENVGDVYKQLLGEYGDKDFLAATDMMIHQLGDDLQAHGTSADKNQIKATVDSLYHLEVAKNTYSAFAKLVNKMHTEFGVFSNDRMTQLSRIMAEQTIQTPAIAAAAHELMSEVLKLKDATFVDGSKVMSIVDRFHIVDIEAKIYFLRELHGIVRKLPLKIYRDDKDRQRLMDAVQDALDRAIDEEDDE